MISPLAIQEFSQSLLLSSIIATEFTKFMYIWAHIAFYLKTLIPLKNPPATTVFWRSTLEVACMCTFRARNLTGILMFIKYLSVHEDYFSLHQKVLSGKKPSFSMKNVLGISRNRQFNCEDTEFFRSIQRTTKLESSYRLLAFMIVPVLGCLTLKRSHDLASHLCP